MWGGAPEDHWDKEVNRVQGTTWGNIRSDAFSCCCWVKLCCQLSSSSHILNASLCITPVYFFLLPSCPGLCLTAACVGCMQGPNTDWITLPPFVYHNNRLSVNLRRGAITTATVPLTPLASRPWRRRPCGEGGRQSHPERFCSCCLGCVISAQ